MKYLLFFLFFLNFVFSNNIQDDFKKLSPKEKITFFLKLDDSVKDENLLFFENEFIRLKEIITNKETKKEYLFCMGMIYQLKKNHIKAITVFNELLNKKNNYLINDDFEMLVLLRLQKSYLAVFVFSKALSCNEKIDKLKNKGVKIPLWEYFYSSNTYFKMNDYDRTIKYLKKEITELKNIKDRDSLIIPSAYNSLGYYYFLNSNHKDALKCYNTSLEIAEKSLKEVNVNSYNELFHLVYYNIAYLYIQENKFEKAKIILEDKLLKNNNENDLVNQLTNDILYVALLIKMNDFKDVDFILNRIDSNVAKVKNIKKDLILNLKLDYYKQINDTKNIIKIQDSLLRYNNYILKNIDKKNKTGAEINLLIEHNKQNEIDNQNKLNEKENKFFIIIIIGLVALLLLILFSVYTNQLKKEKIELLNTSLQQSVHEKDLLLKEIHHRIKNNLQIVSGILELQKSNIKDPVAKMAIDEGRLRIKSIALVHQYMYEANDFSNIKVADFLVNLINSIRTSSANNSIEINTNIAPDVISFNLNTILPLSLIINEAITNCIKHAFNNVKNGEININLFKLNHYFCLEIMDNGVGFPNEVQNQKPKSIGLDLIEGLAKQLDGNVVYSNNNGAKLAINFKPI